MTHCLIRFIPNFGRPKQRICTSRPECSEFLPTIDRSRALPSQVCCHSVKQRNVNKQYDSETETITRVSLTEFRSKKSVNLRVSESNLKISKEVVSLANAKCRIGELRPSSGSKQAVASQRTRFLALAPLSSNMLTIGNEAFQTAHNKGVLPNLPFKYKVYVNELFISD